MNVDVPVDFPFEYELDHIGIAVHSLEEGFSFYTALGFSSMDVEEVPSESVRVAMIELGNACRIELLESTSEEGPIAKFIAKKGTGIHHICLRVRDIRACLSSLKEQNIRLIHEEPKMGAHDCQIAFVHPKATGGVLLELSQPPGGGI